MLSTTARRWRALATLGTVTASVAVAAGSGATWSADSVNPVTTLQSGTLQLSSTRDGLSIVTGLAFKPGLTRTGDVTITNAGSLDGTIKLKQSAGASNGFTSGMLQLEILDVTGGGSVSVWSGDVGAIATAGIDLGQFSAGAARTFRFKVTLSLSAPDADQGKSASIGFQWVATPA